MAAKALRIRAEDFVRPFVAAILVGIGYWALARYSLSIPVKASGISYIWPADGLALGALLCVRRRYWPVILAAVFLGNFAASNKPLELNLLYSSFQVFENTLVAAVIVRVLGARPRLDSVANAALLLAWMAGAMAVATLGSNTIDWLIHRGDYWYVWSVWYISDILGMLIIAPLVIALQDWPHEWHAWSGSRRVEATLVLLGVSLATYLAFVGPPRGLLPSSTLVLTPLLVPGVFMLWGAVRFGLIGAMISMAIMTLLSFRFTAMGLGPFARQHAVLNTALVHLQMSLAIATGMAIFIAARTMEWARALAESQGSRKRLEFAIEASDMVVFQVTPATGEVAWSGDTAFVLGIAPEDLAHMSQWRRRLHPEDRRRVVRMHAQLIGGKVPSLTLDYRLQKRDGTYIIVAADAYAVREPSRAPEARRPCLPLIGVLRNVTERRRIEGDKRRLEERLREAEKLEAIGGLAGRVAHDFNNILGAILGYAEMLQAKTEPASRARKYVDTIAIAGGRGKALVAQILAFSRATDLEKHPVDLRHVLDEVLATLSGSLHDGVHVNPAVPAEPIVVMGNATHLYQLAMNLCTNALQAMPLGGKLTIALDAVEVFEERSLASGTLAPGDYARLVVEDEGGGIPKEVMPRIFEPFFSTKARGKGTGLGLAIAHSVTLAHDGAIQLESHEGRGTRATVYIPREMNAVAVADDHERPIARGHGEVVMVVDDEPHLVEMAQDLLAELGYEPLGFTSAERALAALAAHPQRFDAIVTDEVMPEMSGTDLCTRLRAAGSSLPIVVVTGYGGSGFEARAERAGATRILMKPYRRHELAAALAECFKPPDQATTISAQSTAGSPS